MRASFRIAWLLPACCFLAACGTVHGGPFRARDCRHQYDNCLAACQTAKTECRQMARLNAGQQYLLYLNRQKQNGEPATRTQADFTDFSACNTSCKTGCTAKWRARTGRGER